ncbi:amino acid decarboxylase [Candidatus Bathyarchaeota archaeon]|nr:amino acid decarboxylase [Candidatus Bathyarchaeota archaeon]
MLSHEWKETLDPEDWDKMKTLGHRMLEDTMEYLRHIRDQPFMFPTEQSMKTLLTPLTEKGEGEEKVYELFKEHMVPYTLKWIRPDFWGMVLGTGSPFGMLTDMVISGMNSTTGATMMTVNHHAIDWIKELLEYPMDASGVFVSGGSEANFTGLAVARNAKAEVDMKTEGMQNVPRPMSLYCSEEAHDCLDRSVELLGLGNGALRWIPTDEKHQINLSKLEDEIHRDRENGLHPFCVIGSAGTVHTGAFDDLDALADLCDREDLWFHVDGAFGAWVKLSETHKHLADGLERADSLAVDLHKWMNMPYSIGCTLVQDRVAHFSTFVYGHDAEYLKTGMEEMGDALYNILNFSLPLSRPDWGSKAYMLLRAYGRDKYSNLVQQNIEQIRYLADLVERDPFMEVTAPVASNVICFRYIQDGLSEGELEKLNRMILGELWKISLWMISDTTVKGKYMLRACNVNHRSRKEDFDFLYHKIKEIASELAV